MHNTYKVYRTALTRSRPTLALCKINATAARIPASQYCVHCEIAPLFVMQSSQFACRSRCHPLYRRVIAAIASLIRGVALRPFMTEHNRAALER